jgi:hypothetical protein
MAGSTRRRVAWFAATQVALFAPSAFADASDEGVAKARRELVTRLESIATWCNEKSLHGERDRTFRRILLIDPDHARSRAGLKFKREKKGSPWVQMPDYKEPPDWNKGFLAEAAKRRLDAAVAFRVAALAALDVAGRDLPSGRREALIELMLDVAPEDGELRRARGDVERNGRWWLADTLAAEGRRAEIAGIVREAVHRTPEPVRDAGAKASGWKEAVRTESFHVLGTVDPGECRVAAARAEVARLVLAALFGASEVAPAPRVTYLFPDRDAAQEFLRRNRRYDASLRESDHVSAVWIPNSGYVVYFQDPELRMMGTARELIDEELDARFRGDRERGWIDEGLGQRLCWHVARRHGAYFVNVTGTELAGAMQDAEDLKLPPVDADRIGAAAAVLTADPARSVRPLLTMRINAMRRRDALVAYALAAYLLEARPEALAPFVAASRGSDDPEAMCRDGLGMDAETFVWRLRRWTIETAALGER